jgi:ATP/ADP translocase
VEFLLGAFGEVRPGEAPTVLLLSLNIFLLLTAYFFAMNLCVFWVLGMRGVPLGVPFFLWVGVFNTVTVAQFWSFAAETYTDEQGKRLFPIVGIGSSIGAVGARHSRGLSCGTARLFLS